ncbi:hypothetical protein SH139x_004230 [Planctomycetaceae bacterium SH139]
MECIAGPDAVGIGARAGNHAIHPSPRQNPIFQIYLNRSGGVIADVPGVKLFGPKLGLSAIVH